MTADVVGGVWTYAVDLSRALAARGVAVTLAVIGRISQAQRRAPRSIWNARDRRLFEPRPKEPIVLAAGRLWDEAKNLMTLDEAAPASPWPVYVAGDARHPDGGEACAANARLLGPLSPEELA